MAMLEKNSAASYALHTEAARAFGEGLKIFPADIQLLLKLALTLDNMGRFPEAELVFRAAMEADPKFGPVYAYYGYHNYLQHRLLRAEKLYLKARELGETEVAPLGLSDVSRYRAKAANEETADFFPIEDSPEDEWWEPGEP
jgi:tetratricopeptide (TPR) repeat protein